MFVRRYSPYRTERLDSRVSACGCPTGSALKCLRFDPLSSDPTPLAHRTRSGLQPVTACKPHTRPSTGIRRYLSRRALHPQDGVFQPTVIQRCSAFHSIFGWVVDASPQGATSSDPMHYFCGFKLAQPSVKLPPVPGDAEALPITIASKKRKRTAGHDKTIEDTRFLWMCGDIGSHDDPEEKEEEEDALN